MKKIELITDLLDANDVLAQQNYNLFNKYQITVLNLMGTPGAGKTSILEKTINILKKDLNIGIIEGDLYTTKDAQRIDALGVRVIQINTNGACHLDAGMIAKACINMPLADLDLLIIENVGNLVCPAEFFLGEHYKVMVLSVTEGNDKPWKYPLMFRESTAILLNKIDLLPYTDFDSNQFESDIKQLNPAAQVFPISANSGIGFEGWCRWIQEIIKKQN